MYTLNVSIPNYLLSYEGGELATVGSISRQYSLFTFIFHFPNQAAIGIKQTGLSCRRIAKRKQKLTNQVLQVILTKMITSIM